MTQGGPQFPIPGWVGAQPLRPGASASRAGLSLEQRVAALEAGALGRPGPGVNDGARFVADDSAQGNGLWTDQTSPYYAMMYAANSGSPTHTNSGGWQKVGSGGGTLTWTSAYDIRPSGVSAQADTATNKRIDIRKTGVYQIEWCVGFGGISDAKKVFSGVYRNGSQFVITSTTPGVVSDVYLRGSAPAALTSGDYLELYAWQNDSASEAYAVSVSLAVMISVQYIGPSS